MSDILFQFLDVTSWIFTLVIVLGIITFVSSVCLDLVFSIWMLINQKSYEKVEKRYVLWKSDRKCKKSKKKYSQ